MSEEVKKYTGRVIFFNNKTGYGFIAPDTGEKDLFVYWRNLLMDGFKTLKSDQIVEYELGENAKGKQAVNVRVIKDVPSDR